MTESSVELKKSTVREYVEALAVALIFVNFARIFVFQAFKIPTGSMIDNLLIGDHIIVNKFVYGPPGPLGMASLFGFRKIQRGDIVVFRYPKDPDVDYVKRVIALPGETISIRDKQIFIDDSPLLEAYKVHQDSETFSDDPRQPEQFRLRDQFGPFTVPPGTYFAMGDNRDLSYDSRYWGPVPREYIKGRAFLVYWSFESKSAEEGVRISRARELLDVVIHFFSRTRWDRTFWVVDHKYHYKSQSEGGGTAR